MRQRFGLQQRRRGRSPAGRLQWGFIGGILCGADKLARIAHLAHDLAQARVLGIEAVPSQSTFSRFLGACERKACEALAGLHAWSLRDLPERALGYTLDLDAFALLHEDGQQQGVRGGGYARKGLKPCHWPIVAALAEVPQIANFWLRLSNTACVSNARAFLGNTLARPRPCTSAWCEPTAAFVPVA